MLLSISSLGITEFKITDANNGSVLARFFPCGDGQNKLQLNTEGEPTFRP